MSKLKWIEDIDYSKFQSPYVIERDNQYYEELKMKFNELIHEIKSNGAEDDIVEVITLYKEKILESIMLYFKGDIIKAQTIVNEIIDDLINNEIAISSINDGKIFKGVTDDNLEVQFFRARLNDRVEDFPAEEMLHIPFSKRELVKSERFSIPGVPCLYLGNSSYVCWIEMGRPADFQFNVSPVLLDYTQKVLNLAVSICDLKTCVENVDSDDIDDYKEEIITVLKLAMLNICTSYKVKNVNRNFKSEYIVSQMLMLGCKSKNLDGIAYFSKQVNSEIFASIVGINLALFARYEYGEDYSEICNHVEIGDSFNYSFFKQLLPSLTYKKYKLCTDNTGLINNIGTYNRQFPYNETIFHDFDSYLFANWDRKPKK